MSAAAAGPGRAPGADLAEVLGSFVLTDLGDDVYRGRQCRQTASRTFGGLLMAQTVMAGGHTVDGKRRLHSITGHFLRGGKTDADIDYHVTRLRDGKSLANRRVEVIQGGEVLCSMLLSYQDDRPGLEHEPAMPDVPAPDGLPSLDDVLAGFDDTLGWFVEALRPVHMRYANDPAWLQKDTGEQLMHNRVWMRPDGPLPGDGHLHEALLAYVSDTTLLDSILTTHGLSWGLDRVLAATINHTVWFHRRPVFDDWLLYATESPVAGGGRGLARGQFFAADGTLTASTTQECVVRHFAPAAASR